MRSPTIILGLSLWSSISATTRLSPLVTDMSPDSRKVMLSNNKQQLLLVDVEGEGKITVHHSGNATVGG